MILYPELTITVDEIYMRLPSPRHRVKLTIRNPLGYIVKLDTELGKTETVRVPIEIFDGHQHEMKSVGMRYIDKGSSLYEYYEMYVCAYCEHTDNKLLFSSNHKIPGVMMTI